MITRVWVVVERESMVWKCNTKLGREGPSGASFSAMERMIFLSFLREVL